MIRCGCLFVASIVYFSTVDISTISSFFAASAAISAVSAAVVTIAGVVHTGRVRVVVLVAPSSLAFWFIITTKPSMLPAISTASTFAASFAQPQISAYNSCSAVNTSSRFIAMLLPDVAPSASDVAVISWSKVFAERLEGKYRGHQLDRRRRIDLLVHILVKDVAVVLDVVDTSGVRVVDGWHGVGVLVRLIRGVSGFGRVGYVDRA